VARPASAAGADVVNHERFLGWPGWRHVAYTFVLSALIDLLFFAVYFGADYVTGMRAWHVRLYLAQELAIPLWPWMVIVYDSLYVVLLIVPFVVRTRDAVRDMAFAMTAAIVAAGAMFLLIPAQLGFPPPAVAGPFRAMFEASDRLNLDYNLVPSLHVAFTVICIHFYRRNKSRTVQIALAIWGAALVASTLLTHQHHVLDAIAGAALAWGVIRLRDSVPLVLARREVRVE
jgi:membrane-associated phospholipid phosphatase